MNNDEDSVGTVENDGWEKTPMKYGGPGAIRTPDPQIRRLTIAKRFQRPVHSCADETRRSRQIVGGT